METTFCDVPSCPVGVPHTHPTPVVASSERVLLTIDPAMVEPGMWNSDAHAQYAVAMDAKNGDIVWHRSADWAMFGRMYGWTRVARIYPEMPCDGPAHDFC